jgi:hypothetical protein
MAAAIHCLFKVYIKRQWVSVYCDINTPGVAEHKRSLRETHVVAGKC